MAYFMLGILSTLMLIVWWKQEDYRMDIMKNERP